MLHKKLRAVLALTALSWTLPLAAEESDLKGFLADEIAQQRAWEEKLRAIPKPENLREYMRAGAADRISMPPMSNLDVVGLRGDVTYLGSLLAMADPNADLMTKPIKHGGLTEFEPKWVWKFGRQ